MKIGLVCPYNLSEPGGVQAQVLGLAERLESGGDEVLVIGPGLPEEAAGIDLGSTVGIPANGSIAPISVDPRVVRTIKKEVTGLDVLHVHEPLMPMVSWSARTAPLPIVGTFHAAPSGWLRRTYRLSAPLVVRALSRYDALTAVSATAAAALPGHMNVDIIPNGLDCSAMRVDGERDPRRVAFLGRDEPRKGLDVLLEAWERVAAEVPDAELVVMGSDRETPGITWMGRVDDHTKAEVLSSSAIYVAPNLGGESFGIVVVEGMASGAAVVASSLSSFSAVGDDAVRFVTPGSSTELADAIVALLENGEERNRLGEAGVSRAQAFDWRTVATAYRDVYVSAVGGETLETA